MELNSVFSGAAKVCSMISIIILNMFIESPLIRDLYSVDAGLKFPFFFFLTSYSKAVHKANDSHKNRFRRMSKNIC